MNCIYCGADLIEIDSYFKGRETHNTLGYIYQCPNFEGFETNEELEAYRERMRLEGQSEEEISASNECFSFDHNGHFYTKAPHNDELYEGHPC